MAELASAERHAGREPNLKDLYDAAVWSVPSVREKVLADQRRADDAKRLADAKTKAAAARTAGVSISGAPSTGRMPTTRSEGASIGETLRAAFAEQQGR